MDYSCNKFTAIPRSLRVGLFTNNRRMGGGETRNGRRAINDETVMGRTYRIFTTRSSGIDVNRIDY